MKRSFFESVDWTKGLEFHAELECAFCGGDPAAYDAQNLGDDCGPVCAECLPDAIWENMIQKDEVEMEEEEGSDPFAALRRGGEEYEPRPGPILPVD